MATTSEDVLLCALKTFESNVPSEMIEEASLQLLRAFSTSSVPQQHVESVDAHRQLVSYIVSNPSSDSAPVFCEALLRLVMHQRVIFPVVNVESLEACIDFFTLHLKRKVSIDRRVLVCLSLFGDVVVASHSHSATVVLSFCKLLLNVFSTETRVEDLELTCWRVLFSVFSQAADEDLKSTIVDHVLEVGVERFEAVVGNNLGLFSVDKVRPNEGIKIDFVSGLVLTLVQAMTKRNNVFVSKLVQLACGSAQNREDDKRTRGYVAWMKRLSGDWLSLLRCPEFPQAEAMLNSLLKNLGEGSAVGSPPHMAWIEMTCQTVAHLEKERVTNEKEGGGWLPDLMKKSSTAQDRVQVMACTCAETSFTTNMQFILDCTSCHRWFHGDCVGISALHVNLESVVYICNDCTVFQEAFKKNTKKKTIREEEVPRMLIAAYLQVTFNRTRDFIFQSALLGIPAGDKDLVQTCLSRRAASHLCFLYPQSCPTLDANALCLQMLKTMKVSKQAVVRTHVLKHFVHVLEANPDLFKTELVRLTVEGRLNDESTLVRDSCLDLLSCCPNHVDEYRLKIFECMQDEGISVRKRAVRLMAKHMLEKETLGDNHKQLGQSLGELIRRLDEFKEEETVKDLVRSSLLKFFETGDASKIVLGLSHVSSTFDWMKPFLLNDKLIHKFTQCAEEVFAQVALKNDSVFPLCRVFASHMAVSNLKLMVPCLVCDPMPSESACTNLCEMFALCGPRLDSELGRQSDLLYSLRNNLTRLVFKGSAACLPSVLKACVCLHVPLNLIFDPFMNFLEKESLRNGPSDHIQRSLLSLSLLLKFGGDFVDKKDANRITQALIPYLRDAKHVDLQRTALQAACPVLLRNPNNRELVNAVYSLFSSQHGDIRADVFVLLNQVLVETNESKDKSESHVAQLTSLVTCQEKEYVHALRDEDFRVRRAGVLLLSTMLKRGFTRAALCVSHLIALLRDPSCYEQVLLCLHEVYEREKFGYKRYYSGVLESLPFPSERFDAFSEGYRLFVLPDRKDRVFFCNELASQVLDPKRADQCHFLCQTIARLPFASYQEVLSTIHTLRSKGLLKGTEIRNRLDPVFGPYIKTKDANPDTMATPEIVSDCEHALCVAFALRLSRYLLQLYNCTPARVQDFSPSTVSFTVKEEKLLSPALVEERDKTDPFEALHAVSFPIARLSSSSTLKGLCDSVFVHLVRAMKEDSMPLNAASSPQKKKQTSTLAPASRKRQKKNSEDDDLIHNDSSVRRRRVLKPEEAQDDRPAAVSRKTPTTRNVKKSNELKQGE